MFNIYFIGWYLLGHAVVTGFSHEGEMAIQDILGNRIREDLSSVSRTYKKNPYKGKIMGTLFIIVEEGSCTVQNGDLNEKTM